MKASILIANYNNQIYIDECINSLLNQTYKNIEIIFFDDLSTDNSINEVKKFSKVKLILNKENKKKYGCYNQINSYKEALKKSTGEIIFFLDSDDFFKENKVEEITNVFKKKSELKIVFDLPTYKFKNNLKVKKKGHSPFKTYWDFMPPQSCICVKRKLIDNLFDLIDVEEFPQIWMDFRIGIASKYILKNFEILDKSLTYYRQSDKNISSNYKFLSANWWRRRKEAHNYINFFFKKNNIKFRKNFDYYSTKFINKVL